MDKQIAGGFSRLAHARLLSGCAKEMERSALDTLSLEELLSMQGNLSLLLGFLDALEKLIYNAAEGSAFALRPPEKPVAAFFRLNNPTCQSWFNRIRIGVVIIAMHVQQPELVIRYAQVSNLCRAFTFMVIFVSSILCSKFCIPRRHKMPLIARLSFIWPGPG